MPNPFAYAGILGGVVALGILIYTMFTNVPEKEHQNKQDGQSRTRYEPGYDRARATDWGGTEESSNSSPKRRREAKPECLICTDDLETELTRRLRCGHRFHKNCIIQWFKTELENGHNQNRTRTCPVCRAVI